MSVKWKPDLDLYTPADIVEWHRQGVLTLEEIIDSRRHLTEFGTTLKDYIAECTSARNASRLYLEETIRSLTTRMATSADRKIRSAS